MTIFVRHVEVKRGQNSLTYGTDFDGPDVCDWRQSVHLTEDNGYLTMHLQNAFHEDCVMSLENARMVVQNATAGRKRMQLCNVS